MKIPTVFNQPGAKFVFMADGIKFPPCEGGWQLPEKGHSFEEACKHGGNVGVRAGDPAGDGSIYIGLDQDEPEAFCQGPGNNNLAPTTTTWETRPGRLGLWYKCDDVTAELLAEHGKPANHAQFKLYKDGRAVGEIKLQRCYQVIPNSWKQLDPEDGGAIVSYVLKNGISPTKISLRTLIADILAVGISFKQNAKSDTATCPMVSMTTEAPNSPVIDDTARDKAYAAGALEDEYTKLSQARPGTRYDQAYASACNMGEFVAANLLTSAEVSDRLMIASGLCGLSKKEAVKSITNGLKKTAGKPRVVPPRSEEDKKLDEIMDGGSLRVLTDAEFNAYHLPDGPKFECLLPKEHFIQRLIAYGMEISDAYEDYWYAAGIYLLAVVSDKKIRVELSQGTIYPNVYISINGKSSLARKSTVVNKAEEILTRILNNMLTAMVPTDFSPEAFTEHMSNHQHCPWIRDEAAGVLSLMKKDYMRGFKDCLTSLYDCKPYSRKLRTAQRKDKQTEFIVNDPYLNLLWATTDASFAANTDENDKLSGFLARFLYFFPQGKKAKFMPLREGNHETLSAFEGVVVGQLQEIADKIASMGKTAMHISPEAADFYERWQQKREEEAIESNDGFAMQIFSRANPTVVKLSMLYELGMSGFDPAKPISLTTIEEVCRLMDSYLIPTAKAMYDLVGANAEKNIIDKIVLYLKNHGGRATKNEIMRNIKIKAKEFDEYLSTMVLCGIVRTELYEAHGKGRDSLWLFLEADAKEVNISTIAKVSKIAKIEKIQLEENKGISSTLVRLAPLAPLAMMAQVKEGLVRVRFKTEYNTDVEGKMRQMEVGEMLDVFPYRAETWVKRGIVEVVGNEEMCGMHTS